MVEVFIDGASSGNPGKVGIGYLVYKNQKLLLKRKIYLGVNTNNFAEYMSLVFSLVELLSLKVEECKIYSDSKLLCEQIKGNYKIKSKNIFALYVLAKNLISRFKKIELVHISREKNREADKLAKEAIKEETIKEKGGVR